MFQMFKYNLNIFIFHSDDELETVNVLCTHVCQGNKSSGGCLVCRKGKKVCRFDHPKCAYG
jgi:hypothetical protein